MPAAIERCRRAGIRPVMVTGDHVQTARAIGRELGLLEGEEAEVVDGRELDRLDDDQLAEVSGLLDRLREGAGDFAPAQA